MFPLQGGGECLQESFCDTLWCELCGEGVVEYREVTGSNGCTWRLKHLDPLESRSEEKSVIWLHSKYHHNSSQELLQCH